MFLGLYFPYSGTIIGVYFSILHPKFKPGVLCLCHDVRSLAGHGAVVAHAPVYRAPLAHAAAPVEIYVSFMYAT